MRFAFCRNEKVRVRVRLLDRWYGFHHILDVFPQGTVRRIWIGWWLVTVMVKAG